VSKDETKEEQEEFDAYVTVVSALLYDLQKLEKSDTQQMEALNDGIVTKEIRNLRHSLNRTFSIVKHNPVKIDGKDSLLMDEERLNEFNGLVDDYFLLLDLLKQVFDTEYASIAPTRGREFINHFVPIYEERVDELSIKETGKTWKEQKYSDLYLRKYMLKRINKLGYDLQGQKTIALIQTVSLDEIRALSNRLRAKRQGRFGQGEFE